MQVKNKSEAGFKYIYFITECFTFLISQFCINFSTLPPRNEQLDFVSKRKPLTTGMLFFKHILLPGGVSKLQNNTHTKSH